MIYHSPPIGLLDTQPIGDPCYPRQRATTDLVYALSDFYMVSSGYHMYLERSLTVASLTSVRIRTEAKLTDTGPRGSVMTPSVKVP